MKIKHRNDNNIINDWLDEHGDPEIQKEIEEFAKNLIAVKYQFAPEAPITGDYTPKGSILQRYGYAQGIHVKVPIFTVNDTDI